MHIAVTTRFLLPGNQLEGLGRYTFETLSHLVRQHPECTFHFLFDRPYDPRYLLGPNVVPHVLLPPARHPLLMLAWYEGAVAWWLRRHRPAVLLSPEAFTVLGTRVPRVLVVHDLSYLHRPHDVAGLMQRYYTYFMPRFIRAATQLVAVSETTRLDVAEQFGLPAARIRVAYNAPAAHFRPQPPARQVAVRAQFSQGQPYFLFVGALQPRKNLENLLIAFGLFKAAGAAGSAPARAAAVQLLIVGREAWRAGPIFEAYQALTPAVRAAVHFTGRVSEEELSGLYAAALATVYVPFFEGFGLPVVEAQASGCPVITSNLSSLPEVAGGAGGALLCNPHQPPAIAAALTQLSQDAALRARLQAAGLANAARFSWARSAEVLWQAVQAALK
ncbi:glycosyltransferase family 1 protein [Hymenobacter sp. H14-R3]|uniref:glycosyltransferase family 4 protein n=1 Tax=Hymenobacter sp. H14-R3 TaxID=3046308 RepID=UPI0024BB1CB8|nr:glycosyltransferase family 1 protein [Hymenobacter sp. H14-R3]MDJ0365201.1 glycosyltransferase family 1 protein [Hymenobacter sp. H14-R3]